MSSSIRLFASLLASLSLLGCGAAPTGTGPSVASCSGGPEVCKPCLGQLPVDSKIAISIDGQDFIRAAVPGPECGRFSSTTEYWAPLLAEPSPAEKMTLTISSGDSGTCEDTLNKFLNPSSSTTFQLLTTAQSASWSTDSYTTKHAGVLYSATDPRQGSKKIGLLIELDDTAHFAAASWYEASDVVPRDCIFSNTAATISFEQVYKVAKDTEVDPARIGPLPAGQRWFSASGSFLPAPLPFLRP